MSHTVHDAIVVTASCADKLEPAHAKAVELGLPVSNIVEGLVNGVTTFLIVPDGSKEGWPESDAGDIAREAWVAWAREQWALAAAPPYRGGAFLHFVHVEYGDTSREGGSDEQSNDEPAIVDWQPDEESAK